ncbi:MAG: amidohydrolase family protein [Planctomycetes bacterium]|nr:amidohydrolase family protein [Planctomycetota bacterium]
MRWRSKAEDPTTRAVIAKEWNVDRVVLPDRVQAGARIAAVDGRIVAVDRAAASPSAERLRGTLLPGFVDLQCNGAGGRSVDEGTSGALDTIAAAVFKGGAVAFLPTLITAPWPRLLEQIDAVARWIEGRSENRGAGDESGPGSAEPLGLHLEGPFLTTPGAHDPAQFVEPTAERIDALLAAARGTLRLVTLANARPGAAAAIARLRQAGVTCAIGHCAEPMGFAECVAAGATAVTHLFNAMGPLHHRDDNVAALALDCDRLTCPLILDGVHVSPTMVRNAFAILGPERMALVTDAVAAAGQPDGDYTLSGIPVRAENGIVRDGAGRLAGSALTMAMAARNFLDFVPGAGAWTLARIASANPARLVGAERFGAIATGRRAAFTLLGDDGSVTTIR